jgi:glyoxylate reductase
LTDQTRYTYNWIGLEDFGTVYRKTLGIVGLGYVGRAVAERMRPFGVRLLYYKRYRLDPEEEERLGVEYRERDELLQESDIVTLHHRFHEGPDGNDKDFGAREFALMKPTAYLVNTARGRLVDEDALVEALSSGQLAGVGLDVFRHEPLPSGHPLLRMAREQDNVIITPHVAGAPGDEAQVMIAQELVEHVQAALR